MEYLLTFLEGIASFISPCILPLLPVYVSYFAGNGVEESNAKKTKTFVNSLGFVIGFTIAFVLLAVFASTIGSAVNTWISYLKVFFGLCIIVLGLHYMEIIQIKLLNRSINLEKKGGANFLGMMLFGLLFSISLTPCVGAFLASALMLIAKEQSVGKGVILILLYSLGMGIPFLVSAVFIDKLKSTFQWIKKHYDVVKRVSGSILIFMGIYVIFF